MDHGKRMMAPEDRSSLPGHPAKMCGIIASVFTSIGCGINMLIRIFLSTLLMIENLIRLVLQTVYNCLSTLFQLISLLPICLIFLLSSRLCSLCGGGGMKCSQSCECVTSAVVIAIIIFILKSTGYLDKILLKLGYIKIPGKLLRFAPTPEDITDRWRNDYGRADEDSTIDDCSTDVSTVDYSSMDYSTTDDTTETSAYKRLADPLKLSTVSFYVV